MLKSKFEISLTLNNVVVREDDAKNMEKKSWSFYNRYPICQSVVGYDLLFASFLLVMFCTSGTSEKVKFKMLPSVFFEQPWHVPSFCLK